ncbi:MAG: hypothetical protein V4534_09010 [Myxococcota bacterium]
MVRLLYSFLLSATVFATTPTLADLWQEELDFDLADSDPNILADKHVLFVSGVMNELVSYIPGYFVDCRESVEKELGGKSSYFGPPSKNSISENAVILRDQVLKAFFENGQKPLVILAHSKGAAEILYLVLEQPAFMLDNLIEKIVLIQGAIGGTPLANEPNGWFAYEYLSRWIDFNAIALSQIEARRVFAEAFESYLSQTTKAQQQNISSRIYYVRTQEELENLSLSIRLGLKVARSDLKAKGANDGFLLTAAQMHPDIGVDLGVLQADHLSLVLGWITGLSANARRAFTRALFRKIY